MSKLKCTHCDEEIGNVGSIRGQWIPCPGCHQSIHVPLYDDPQQEQQVLVAEQPVPADFSCPGCGAGSNENAQFCTSCGFNLKPNMPLASERVNVPARSMSEFSPDKGLMMGAYITGAIGAVIAGLLWGLVAYLTGMEFGFGAIGVGFLVGTATRLGTSHRGKAVGMIAVMMAVLGLIVGKAVIADWVFSNEVSGNPSDSAIMEVINDEDLMADAAYYDLVVKGRVGNKVQEWAEKAKDGELPPKELEVQVQKIGDQIGEYFSFPLEKQKAVARDYLGKAAEEYAKLDTFSRVKGMLSFWDILWAALAISTAYRICSRERAYPHCGITGTPITGRLISKTEKSSR